MGEKFSSVSVARRAIVRRVADGCVVRGVFFVRREVRVGKVSGTGFRDGRDGRRVDVRSRVLRAGNLMGASGGEERVVRGLERRERVVRCGRVVRWVSSLREVKALEDKLRVFSWVVCKGASRAMMPLEAAEKVVMKGKLDARATI